MGKPITQAEAEIEKCILHLDYYILNSSRFLKTEQLDVQPSNLGEILHQPLGPTLGKYFSRLTLEVIMPWNFPFWLPFKSVIPPLVLGNSILLKHSP